MAIVRKGTFSVISGGTAQNLILGFVPNYFNMMNKTKIIAAGTGLFTVTWWDDLSNGTAYTTSNSSAVLAYLSTNGITPYVTSNSSLYTETNLTITGISQAANAVITANNSFTSNDYGVTVVTFHTVEGMTQINTLSGVVQSATSSNFVVNINTTGFSAYTSGGIANIITGIPALQGGLITSGNALGFPPAQTNTFQVLNTALFNNGALGLTLGTSLMVTTSDVWEYLAVLDTDITSA